MRTWRTGGRWWLQAVLAVATLSGCGGPGAASHAAARTEASTEASTGAPRAPATSRDIATNLQGVSCPTTDHCVAVGTGAILITRDGRVWRPAKVPAAAGPDAFVVGVSCAGSRCVALATGQVGHRPEILLSADGGSDWTAHAAPPGVSDLEGVACATPRACVAVGARRASTYPVILRSGDAGRTWTEPALGSVERAGVGLFGVSCPSADACVVVGSSRTGPPQVVLTTSDGGLAWQPRPVPPDGPGLVSVSCSSVSACTTIGGAAALTSTDGGASWHPDQVPAGMRALSAVSCPPGGACVAVGLAGRYPPDRVLHLEGAQRTMVSSHFPVGTQGLNGVTCARPGTCVVVGNDAIRSTTDGGAHWAAQGPLVPLSLPSCEEGAPTTPVFPYGCVEPNGTILPGP